MIDKDEFYHGAAVIRLVDDARCQKIRKEGFGYVINEEAFVLLKYSAKSRSPWGFTFGNDEIERLNSLTHSHNKIVIALTCGGDGVCAISWKDAEPLLGSIAGWISVRRNFNEQYGVAGPKGILKGKVSLRQWPSIVFGID